MDYTEAGMLRLMKGLDLSHQKTLPGHPQSDPAAQRDFQKGGWRAR
ncbi:winged helix-turn-helix domain-containing protein [Pinisolibacter sp. B13]|nr:winged helix-turn-helix domain-containing protein [Pinisolibacter aquiterrae]